MAKETIFAEQELEFTKVDGEVIYATVWAPAPNIAADDTVTISWDGVEYTCIYKVLPDDEDIYYAGNEALIGVGDDTGEPFCLVSIIVGDDSAAQIGTFSTDPTHTVAIYKEATSAPQIVLLDKGKNEHKFPLDLPLLIPDTEGGLREYSYGAALTDMEIPLDLASGNQPLAAPDGYLVKTATILKPDTLLPENIKSGVEIAGVMGDYAPDTEEVTVELDMAEGDQTIIPSEGKLLAKATVKRPETLVPENILQGVEIGGVVGSAVTKVDTEETTVELDFSSGDMIVEPTEGKFLSRVDIPKPETLVPENIAKDVNIAGVVGTHEGGGGATEPYIEYTYDASGNIIAAKLYGFTSIRPYAFYLMSTLQTVDLTHSPDITSIGQYAFYDCSSLTSIELPDSVTSIGYSAFYNCRKLIRIRIPSSVTSIDGSAFYNCYKLIEVYNLSTLPITVGSSNYGYVGYYARNVYTATEGTSKLWTGNDGYTFYEDSDACYLMRYTGNETALTLPAACNEKNYEVYQYAFYDCSSLTSITIPDSVTSIGSSAFMICESLASVRLPTGLTSIGDYAFSGCKKLTSIVIPDGVTSIGNGAFQFTALTSITIPANVKKIGSYAFYNCKSLATAVFKNTSGWYVSTSSTATSGTNLTSSNLAKTSTAATYLKTTYYSYYWFKK